MKRAQLIFAFSLFLFLPQAKAQVGLYGNVTASKLNAANTNWFYGPTFGAYYNGIHLPVVAIGMDARVAILGSGAEPATKVDSGLIGPRVVLHLPALPLKPYAEGLVGAGHVQVGEGVAYQNGTHLNYGVAVGADLTFFPRLDWRVVEYTYTRFPNVIGGDLQTTLSTGLVFRLPIP